MTVSPDPIDDVRAELARIPGPTEGDLDAQRARLDAAMRSAERPTRTRRLRGRWLPASGFAVATLAVGILVAVALQPGGGGDERGGTAGEPKRAGFQLVTGGPGGAFSGLDLDSASAADVLEAAGETAARGADGVAGKRWTYVRLETVMPNVHIGSDQTSPKVTVRTIDEKWVDTSSGRTFAISSSSIPGRDPQAFIHYEFLEERTIGSVSWTSNDGFSPGDRRATWHTSAGDGEVTVRMHEQLRDRLPDARDAADVQAVLDDVVDGPGFRFEGGMACMEGGSCMGFGPPVGGRDLTPEESRDMYARGLLLNTTAYDVYPPASTRAIYEYLASTPGAVATPLEDGSGNVQLTFTPPGATPGTGERIVIDDETGRIVERGRESHGGITRWTAVGASDTPMDGGTLCGEFPERCDELRDLHDRLQDDPKARFNGVVDWMFIQQFCDGMINRDGSVREGDHLPRSMSKDPKVKAEREACEKREAAAAQGG
jgi:hypothetical protein